jgi:hypothetical protein
MTPHNHPRPHARPHAFYRADTQAALLAALLAPAGRKAGNPPTGAPSGTCRPTIAPVATSASTAAHSDQSDQEVLRRTRLGLALTLRDLHRFTLGGMSAALVPDDVHPDEYAGMGRRLEFLAKRAKVMWIILARVRGVSWADIARKLGQDEQRVQHVYAPMEAAWRAGSQTPWAPELPGAEALTGLMPVEPDGAEEADLLPYLWVHRDSSPPR